MEGKRYEKETIIVVHGTFSGVTPNETRWWQSGSEIPFQATLHSYLERNGVQAKCWSHCGDGMPEYNWSGNNHWIDRIDASRALTAHIARLHAAGWACHLVGHSHGGNVISEALEMMQGKPVEKAVLSVVTLGTPFVDVSKAVKRAMKKRQNGLMVWWTVPVLLMLFLAVQSPEWVSMPSAVFGGAVGAFCLFQIGGILLSRIRRREGHLIPGLAVSSPYDEAWQLLHHVRETPNVLKVKGGVIRYVVGRVLNRANESWNVRLVGSDAEAGHPVVQGIAWSAWVLIFAMCLLYFLLNPSWVSAGVSGFAWFMFSFILNVLVFVGSLGSPRLMATFEKPMFMMFAWCVSTLAIPREIATYIVRWQSWSLLQRWALGCEGFSGELPRVDLVPKTSGSVKFDYVRVSAEVEKRALESRANWLGSGVGAASDVFANMVLSAGELNKVLERLERDQSLVHGVYYSDRECVELLGAWICQHSRLIGPKETGGVWADA